LAQEIKPRGIVERIYVDEIAALVWEILRLRRCKAAIVNAAFKGALSDLLSRLIDHPDWDNLKALVSDWFSEPTAKKEVSQLLAEYHLDETAIEGEAIRSRSAELEVLDRMLTSLESRRNRALRCIADYQEALQSRCRRFQTA
jgi:ATP phosphoribosyltransferase regulatory subunit HisZ